jgi:predicted RNase H-like HicB family nuclease
MDELERDFSAVITHEGDWYVAQCLEVDVASQGRSEAEALASLQEALELHFLEPTAASPPPVKKLRVKVRAA